VAQFGSALALGARGREFESRRPDCSMRTVGVILAVVAAAVAAGCGGSSNRAADASPFAYDTSAPLDYVDRGVVNHGYPIKVHDVTFTSAGGRKVDGLLTVPPGKGPFPAVVYLHGSGGDRTELLVPATWMAARRVVALTLTMPEGSTSAGTPTEQLVAQKEGVVDSVIAARRAVDALAALPQVDPDRIGLVGWSSGARIGAILAGIEPRLKAFDLLSGGSPPVEEYASQAPESLRPAIRRELGAVDPLRWVAKARPGSVLLQDGRKDTVVPRAALLALAKAAGKAAEVRWYPAQGHAPGRAAYADQLDWIASKLVVTGSPVKGASAGP
jgi:dienelactone hydrolase